MEDLFADPFIYNQAVAHPLSEIEDCAIAVDATYYLQLHLDVLPNNEPLLPALGGLTGIQGRIESELDQWKANNVTPFFIFDGQSMTGQDDAAVRLGRRNNAKTDISWDLYFNGRADEAVTAFGQSTIDSEAAGPPLPGPPFSAAAQMAYFELCDSDQCAGIMGSSELLLYPIRDCVIRTIDWDAKMVYAVSKKHILKTLNVSESLFVDAFLMTGTSFLVPFPPLEDQTIIKTQPCTVADAVNMLRTAEKSVTLVCTSFHDILKSQDPNWLDKYRKARMAVDHFIYIAENGEVKVHDYEHLTKDNHEYLGLQLPSELFHYLNTGLIGPRVLSWITHGQLQVLPTLDGVASDEYKKLITTQSVRIKEAALSLVIPRLNRGIGYKNISMKVWYDRNFSYTVWDRHEAKANFAPQVASWNMQESAVTTHFPHFAHGSIISEVMALKNPEFVAATRSSPKEKMRGVESAAFLKSICLWRFLHIRGYVDDQHELNKWGSALAAALSSIEPTVTKNPNFPHLYESVLVAFELIRFELLNARNKHEELRGLPLNGSEDDQASLLLISRCASLLKLRHQANGYTGPLSKNLLAFRSLVSEVRSADRDLVEAILASMFMYAQAKRNRDDGWELSHQLPFLYDPDVALGIAVKTYFDDLLPNDPDKQKKLEIFPGTYVPYAEAFAEDLDIACSFFEALYAGVKTLDSKEMPAVDRITWDKAAKYLASRR
ncbi:59aa6d8f-db14-430c-9cc9-ef2153efa8f4 [Thermothielavioides terrestris]|uniref:59aa6d8f-db14-430c-9cc9-ef2153efa8f4 n=1 Tax=Thermothielavioides terrestris TaxID=2587410 RepID=A0A446BF87_9PEZI|nr:59aa6d8f-db14-430c-9cc9-ef2153efa8f4 [Thermothielavioides terrestris]